MKRILNQQFHGNKQVHILGYTNHVALYMDACDVIFTKPGGLTSTEALVKSIPLIHTAPIPGCETKNSSFFTEHGLSFASKYMIEQIRLGQLLIQDKALAQEMQAVLPVRTACETPVRNVPSIFVRTPFV